MIGELTNHLWQSTIFAVLPGLLTLAFRKHRAQVRYWLWLSASFKFLVPFSLLMSVGSHLQWMPAARKIEAPAVSTAMLQVTQPFPNNPSFVPSAPGDADWTPAAMLAMWVCGFGAITLMRARGWRRIQAAVRSGTPANMLGTILVRSSPGLLEPGVVGLFRPILLLPTGIAERLKPPQLEAVLAHELCHVRRHDNLTSAIHMIVEALFWFHPLVWWIGARLVEERERACDEAVLALGSEPHDYAEGILNVYRSYLESPLSCASGVTGSDLKKRIEEIMKHQNSPKLDLGRKLLLAATAFTVVATPIIIGIMNPQPSRAQQQTAAPLPFEVASVRPNKSTDRPQLEALPGGTLTIRNAPISIVIMVAYKVPQNAPERVSGMPKWAESERFDIEAKAPTGAIPGGLSEKQRYDKSMLMLQSVLADRFRMTTHWETKQGPMYSLTVAKSGLKLPRAKIDEKDCPEVPTRTEYCHFFYGGQGRGLHGKTITMTDLVDSLQGWADHPVIDNTGVNGLFDIDTEGWVPMRPRPGPQPGTEPSAEDRAFADPARPTLQQVLNKVGLKLESTKGPIEILVIDNIEPPLEN